MSIAAVPKYLPDSLRDAAPGHRFNLYFPLWSDGSWLISKSDKTPALKSCTTLGDVAKAQVAALRTRQQTMINRCGANGYRVTATSTAPFATGLGNEHPIENGFAFLTPYGLPYLAGSGVKGILRRAMQELTDDGEEGFTDDAINALLGAEEGEQPEGATRGALDFWDVFPKPAGDKLVVEIMTPHYAKYYQGEEAPHDSRAPVPVSFLAVPAKSQFDFHVVCHATRLPVSLQTQWRALLDRAFQHAFDWVGFGAKTSVGYGALASIGTKLTTASSAAAALADTAPTAPVESWPAARLKFNRGNNTLTAQANGKTANAYAPHGEAILQTLPASIQSKIRQNQCFEKFRVQVAGNVLVSVGS